MKVVFRTADGNLHIMHAKSMEAAQEAILMAERGGLWITVENGKVRVPAHMIAEATIQEEKSDDKRDELPKQGKSPVKRKRPVQRKSS